MSARDPLDELALDYLYGLLDAAEADAARAKLDTLEGRAALDRAGRVQKLLAAAAKSDFPDVRFEPPAEPARASSPVRRWLGWAVAVAALIAVGTPPAANVIETARYQRELAEGEIAQRDAAQDLATFTAERVTRLQAAEQSVALARQELDRKQQTVVQEVVKAQQDLRAKQLSLVISGPATLTAGAPNDYRVQTVNGVGMPTVAQLSARVRDQNGAVVYEEKLSKAAATWNLKLPANLPLTPSRELFLELEAKSESGPKSELRERLQLATPMFVTHFATDKPMYQPGETVRFRSLTLDRLRLRPPTDDFTLMYVVRDPLNVETVVSTGRAVMAGPDGKPVRGIGAGEWAIPESAGSGEWTLAVRELAGRFPEEKRTFLVNKYQPARLNKVLEWSKKSYGPGETVVANVKVERAEGGPVAGKPVTAEVSVDDTTFRVGAKLATDSEGRVAVRFALPAKIDRGVASLSLGITDGGSVEPLSKPIPVVLKKYLIDFYPEGGDLVAGVPNRVYFQVRSTLGKPADVTGRVVDAAGQTVAAAATLTDGTEAGINQGQGRAEFTPEFGQTYKLVVDAPAGTEGEYRLPAVKPEGVVLAALDPVSADPQPLRVRVHSAGAARSLFVGAYARGRMLDHRRISVPANGAADVELHPEGGLGGVTRVTVFEEQGGEPKPDLRPVAERLVYRRPAAKLKLALKPDKPRYAPGEKASVLLTAADEKGDATGAVLCVGVVNQSVVTMADEKTYRSMPTFVYLTSEVRTPEELEHADVLLGDHPKAAAALDLLLGTQGWRRFVESVPSGRPKGGAGFAADAALLKMHSAIPAEVQRTSLELELGRVHAKLEPEVAAVAEDLTRATADYESVQADATYAAAETEKQRLVEAANAVVAAARAKLVEAIDARRRMLDKLLPGLAAVALAVALAALVYGFARGGRSRQVAAGALFVAVCAAFLSALHWRTSRDGAMPTSAPTDRWARNELALADAPARAEVDVAAVKGLAEARDGGLGVKDRPDGEAEAKLAEALGAQKGDAKNDPNSGPGASGLPAAPAPPRAQPPGPGAQPPKAAAVPAPGEKAKAQAEAERLRVARGADALRQRNLREPGRDGKPDEQKAKEPMGEGAADKRKKALGGLDREAAEEMKKVVGDKKEAGRPWGFGGEKPAGGGFGPVPGGVPGGGIGGGGGMPQGRFGGRFDALDGRIAAAPPFVVREYAHARTPRRGEDRGDFAETLYWHPALVVAKGGTPVTFDLADAVTSYRVLAIAHTADGRLGELATQLEVRKPVSLEPKLPVEVTAGDTLDVALTVSNDTDAGRTVEVEARTRGLAIQDGTTTRKAQLAPQQRGREVFRLKPTDAEGQAELRFVGTSGIATDAYFARLPVVPEGFPVQGAYSDALERVARHEVVLPETWVRGTLKCSLNVYPSTLSELQKGLEGLLGEPGGCFEQTSTTNYPNALVLQYLKESDQANPDVMRNARAMLERGYAKLTSFEVPAEKRREGFEWFGQSPAHEALTAYGLMQFKDMARVTDVDPMLIDRTRSFLLSRRDGKGGFTRNPLALDSFGRAPPDVTNAYIVWAVTEAGEGKEVDPELDACATGAKKSADPYLRALVANALLNRGRADEGLAMLRQLAEKLSPDGALRGAAMSITGSGGRSLEIETTALALMGWLKANRPADFSAATRAAAGWIGKQRSGSGGFGATQSTILALKSLIEYTRANKQTPEPGTLSLYRGAELVGRLDFAAGTQGVLSIPVPDADAALKPGKNELRAEIGGKNNYPYTLGWSYQTLQPPSAEGCAVRLAASLDRTDLDEGGAARLKVTLENVSGKGQGMAVAVIGLPAGMKLPDDFKQLREMKQLRNGKPGPIGSFEVRGRELILYWRDLAPDAKIDLAIDVLAHVPGIYRGPASRAYLYYTPELKHWVAPLAATIKAK